MNGSRQASHNPNPGNVSRPRHHPRPYSVTTQIGDGGRPGARGYEVLERLETARLWDGTPLPPGLQARLQQSWAHLVVLNEQRRALQRARTTRVADPKTATGRAVQTPVGIGPIGAWVLATEIFGWRQIRNGRELGALVGLVPAPFQSGQTSHDLGITRAGNKHVRWLMVQLAWSWVRFQPQSALAQWYQRRFGGGGRRLRRIGIVALARKLLIALWRLVKDGVIPEGAAVTAAA